MSGPHPRTSDGVKAVMNVDTELWGAPVAPWDSDVLYGCWCAARERPGEPALRERVALLLRGAIGAYMVRRRHIGRLRRAGHDPASVAADLRSHILLRVDRFNVCDHPLQLRQALYRTMDRCVARVLERGNVRRDRVELNERVHGGAPATAAGSLSEVRRELEAAEPRLLMHLPGDITAIATLHRLLRWRLWHGTRMEQRLPRRLCNRVADEHLNLIAARMRRLARDLAAR